MKLIDRIMEKFFSVFGCYPRSAGSFILDSDSVKYLKEKQKLSITMTGQKILAF